MRNCFGTTYEMIFSAVEPGDDDVREAFSIGDVVPLLTRNVVAHKFEVHHVRQL